MEKYIYINYAYEDYQLIQKIIEDIEKMGVKVCHGNGSEEKVAGSLCVVHFWTPAAHTSKSYRKIMNYTLKHELDTMLFHLDGGQMASEIDVQLDVLHALFKYKYQMLSRKAEVTSTPAAAGINDEVKKSEEAPSKEIIAEAKQEVKPEPEVVKVNSADELKTAMAASEPKVIKFNVGSASEPANTEAKDEKSSAKPASAASEAKVSAAIEKAKEPVRETIQPEVVKNAESQPVQNKKPEETGKMLTTRDELFAEGMRILENGKTREDGVKAFKYLRQAASQGHTEAQYQLSVCYDRGIGVRKSITEAAKWCQMAAFGGHAKAQSEIGYCYEYGQGVVRNIKEAVSWYEMASAQGNIQAKNNLAFCYQKGRGVHKDVKEAIRLYEEAAAGGHASAQYNLGYCYWYGEGVKTDKNRAIELFKQSADNGNAKAAQMLKILSQHLFMK